MQHHNFLMQIIWGNVHQVTQQSKRGCRVRAGRALAAGQGPLLPGKYELSRGVPSAQDAVPAGQGPLWPLAGSGAGSGQCSVVIPPGEPRAGGSLQTRSAERLAILPLDQLLLHPGSFSHPCPQGSQHILRYRSLVFKPGSLQRAGKQGRVSNGLAFLFKRKKSLPLF